MKKKKKKYEKQHQWEYERDKFGPKRVSGHSGYIYYKKEDKYKILAVQYTLMAISLLVIIVSACIQEYMVLICSAVIFFMTFFLYIVIGCGDLNHPTLPVIIVRRLQFKKTCKIENKNSFDQLAMECYYYSEKLKHEKRLCAEIRFGLFNIRKISISMDSSSYLFRFHLKSNRIVFRIKKRIYSRLTKKQKIQYKQLITEGKVLTKSDIDVSIYSLPMIEMLRELKILRDNVFELLPDYWKTVEEKQKEERRLIKERVAKNKKKK